MVGFIETCERSWGWHVQEHPMHSNVSPHDIWDWLASGETHTLLFCIQMQLTQTLASKSRRKKKKKSSQQAFPVLNVLSVLRDFFSPPNWLVCSSPEETAYTGSVTSILSVFNLPKSKWWCSTWLPQLHNTIRSCTMEMVLFMLMVFWTRDVTKGTDTLIRVRP